ncbi:hypothetical protein [Streptomyces sp. URMC 123]|uniref:hypothetical protein n=1 Tax=Streptomyces sp. URMC 123 TaxID=3423403 RepID=UPI003F1A5CB8
MLIRRARWTGSKVVVAGLGALLATQLGAAGGAWAAAGAPVAAARGERAAAGEPSAVARITEGQVAEVGPGGALFYPSVTSCLTISVRLRNGGKVGAHASLFQVPGEYRSDQILPALRDRVGSRAVATVEVKGAVGAWHPDYFTTAIESHGPGDEVPFPAVPDPEGLARAVARGLGLPRGAVTVEDVPDGDLTVR